MKACTFLGILVVVFALSFKAAAKDNNASKSDLLKLVLADINMATEQLAKGEDYSPTTAEIQLKFGMAGQKTMAILRMWIEGRSEFLMLTWYRSKDRTTRCLICSLFIANQISLLYDPKDGKKPEFLEACRRFTEPEDKERLEEFNLVRSNVLALAKEWLKLLDGKVKVERLESLKFAAKLTQRELDELRSEGWESK